MRYPVWIHPTADGKTPMCEALGRVKEMLERWLLEHPRGFPPTVLHLTDGESSDGDPNEIGQQIMSLGTDDGAVLLFNCHISTRRSAKIEYPTDEAFPARRIRAFAVSDFESTCPLTFSRLPRNSASTPWMVPEDLFSMAIHHPSFSFMKSARVSPG